MSFAFFLLLQDILINKPEKKSAPFCEILDVIVLSFLPCNINTHWESRYCCKAHRWKKFGGVVNKFEKGLLKLNKIDHKQSEGKNLS